MEDIYLELAYLQIYFLVTFIKYGYQSS